MARFEKGERVQYRGPTTEFIANGDFGTVDTHAHRRDYAWVYWDNSPHPMRSAWCAMPGDLAMVGGSWLRRVTHRLSAVLS